MDYQRQHALAIAIGIIIGLVAAYSGRWWDWFTRWKSPGRED